MCIDTRVSVKSSPMDTSALFRGEETDGVSNRDEARALRSFIYLYTEPSCVEGRIRGTRSFHPSAAAARERALAKVYQKAYNPT